jgi:hypothetical protein
MFERTYSIFNNESVQNSSFDSVNYNLNVLYTASSTPYILRL